MSAPVETAVAEKPEPKGFGFFKKKRPDHQNPVTLKLFVRRALKDSIEPIKVDPYLKRKLARIEAKGNLKKAYGEIDKRIAKAVDFALRNREPNERVRGATVTCGCAADLTERIARCVIIVDAWGLQCREYIDLELPET